MHNVIKACGHNYETIWCFLGSTSLCNATRTFLKLAFLLCLLSQRLPSGKRLPSSHLGSFTPPDTAINTIIKLITFQLCVSSCFDTQIKTFHFSNCILEDSARLPEPAKYMFGYWKYSSQTDNYSRISS